MVIIINTHVCNTIAQFITFIISVIFLLLMTLSQNISQPYRYLRFSLDKYFFEISVTNVFK